MHHRPSLRLLATAVGGTLLLVGAAQAQVYRVVGPDGRVIAGLNGNPPEMQTIAYNTSKGAVINFTRALAAEWGRYGIRVNTIAPGLFLTPMMAALPEALLS